MQDGGCVRVDCVPQYQVSRGLPFCHLRTSDLTWIIDLVGAICVDG
jgi:hypothetical protein